MESFWSSLWQALTTTLLLHIYSTSSLLTTRQKFAITTTASRIDSWVIEISAATAAAIPQATDYSKKNSISRKKQKFFTATSTTTTTISKCTTTTHLTSTFNEKSTAYVVLLQLAIWRPPNRNRQFGDIIALDHHSYNFCYSSIASVGRCGKVTSCPDDIVIRGIYLARYILEIWEIMPPNMKLKMHSPNMVHWEMFGWPEILQDLLLSNLKTLVMQKTRLEG